uniref:Uncharacterized protein n=1 Tax=Marseillevirus sp. TaxID=2809551 RepID=A0AA96ENK1_9VIRU|nr:hypothetical protein MarDSR_324 [Marseillevirus sp.]
MLFSKILESFQEIVPKNVLLSIYGRNFLEKESQVSFAFAIFFNDSSIRETIRNKVFVVSFNALSDTFPSNNSDSAILSTLFSNNFCSTEEGGGGLTPGETAGIVIGAIIGAAIGAAALAALIIGAFIVFRLMNKAPAPEQLTSQTEAFTETVSKDNAIFADPVQSVNNELYTL